MKLVIAVVQDNDAPVILDALSRRKQRATKLASTGGFLREGNTTLLMGVEDDDVETVISIIARHGESREKLINSIAAVGGPMDAYVPYPIEVVVGGAILFTLDVEKTYRF